MNVRWTASARQDRDDIYEQIAEHDQAAADRLDLRFEKACRQLANFPFSARIGKLPGTRELVPHQNYRLVYEVTDIEIVVHAVIHTSRQWPPELEDGS